MLLLSSGLFLGWSLGANHGGNLFGPAVGAKMLPFYSAAVLCSILVIIGAVVGGAGATATLGALGAISTPGGAFVTALATAATITLMSRLGLPVSTSQAIVGAIIGWNLFAGAPTGVGSLTTIVASWIAAPLIAGIVAAATYVATRACLCRSRMHLLTVDAMTRSGLVAVSAFGAYSLGANNVANVMGVFVPAAPFSAITVAGLQVSPTHQLFALGGVAIAAGILTYSRRVVRTVGRDLLRLSPVAALVVLFAHGLVLFLFSSQEVGVVLSRLGLPRIPLVPVSSTQAITGAILGIGVVKRARGLRVRVLGDIALGWVTAPPLAAVACYVGLFFAQNVFELEVKDASQGSPITITSSFGQGGMAGISPPLDATPACRAAPAKRDTDPPCGAQESPIRGAGHAITTGHTDGCLSRQCDSPLPRHQLAGPESTAPSSAQWVQGLARTGHASRTALSTERLLPHLTQRVTIT